MNELKIKFNGDVPGLSEGVLSIRQFGQALQELEKIVRDEVSHLSNKGTRTSIKALSDLQITSLEHGCTTIGLSPVITGVPSLEQQPFGHEALILDAIVNVSKNIKRGFEGGNVSVRYSKYLGLLPKGLESHEYTVLKDNQEIFHSLLGAIALFNDAVHNRVSLRVSGVVAAIDFEKNKLTIISDMTGNRVSGVAEDALIEKALAIKSEKVSAFMMRVPGTKSMKVLWIKKLDDFQVKSPELRLKHIKSKWGNLLEVLSK